MCLLLEVELPGFPRTDAGKVTIEASSLELLALSAIRQAKSAKGSKFLIGPGIHGCACGLSTASEDSEYFVFYNDAKEPLKEVIEFLAKKAGKSGLKLHVYYSGTTNAPIFKQLKKNLTLTDFVQHVINGRVRNNTIYSIESKQL